MSEPLRIISLEARNVKRLRAVSVRPALDRALIEVSGRNAAGKSSLLDSIMYCLGGAKHICKDPIRDGESKAEVRIDLGPLVAVRTWERNRHTGRVSTHLEVKGADGTPMRSPQAILDQLVTSQLAFRPVEFTRERPAAQGEILRQLIGLDFTDLDAERAKLYDERTTVGRDLRRLDAQAEGMPEHPGAPLEEVSIAELSAELERRLGVAGEIKRLQDEHAGRERRMREMRERARQIDEELSRLRAEQARLDAEAEQIGDAEIAGQKRMEAIGDAPPVEPVQEQIAEAERVNRAVRANADRRALLTQADEARAQYAKLSDRIGQIDLDKERQIAAAEYPLPGLGFRGDGGVLWNGHPLEQASQAEQMRVAAAIGIRMSRLPLLLVTDGSLLDSDSMAALEEIVAAADGQAWVERVGDGGEAAVRIVDGALAS